MILYRLTGSDLWYEIARRNDKRMFISNLRTEGNGNDNNSDNGDDKEINVVN